MKQHGLHQSASSSRETPVASPVTPKEPKPKLTRGSKTAGPPASKKRKMASMDGGATAPNQDDDEGIGGILQTHQHRGIKDESDVIVKDEEPMTDPVALPAAAHPHYHNVETGNDDDDDEEAAGGASDDGLLFNDFLHVNAFEPQPHLQGNGTGVAHQGFADGHEDSKASTDVGATELGVGASSSGPVQGSILID